MKSRSKQTSDRKVLKISSQSRPHQKKSNKKKSKNASSSHTLPKPSSKDHVKHFSFTERCKRVSLNPTLFLKGLSKPEENQTQFNATLQKWKTMNLASIYEKFQQELGNEHLSTNQLVLNHKQIANKILQYLKRPGVDVTNGDTLEADNFHSRLQYQIGKSIFQYDEHEDTPKALEPLLELIVSLSKDIPSKFFQHHLYKFLPHLISHTFIQNATQLQQVFNCLAGVLTNLKTLIALDKKAPYKLYKLAFSELLSSKRSWFINDFGAQAYACVLNNSGINFKAFFNKVYGRKGDLNSQVVGLGKLITALCRGSSLNQVHKNTTKVMESVLSVMMLKESSGNKDIVLESLLVGLKGLAFFVTKKNPNKDIAWDKHWSKDGEALVWKPVWNILQSILNKEFSGDSFKEFENQLASVLKIIQFLCNFKRGALLPCSKVAYGNILKVISNESSDEVSKIALDTALDILRSPHHQSPSAEYNPNCEEQINRNELIDSIFASTISFPTLFNFCKRSVAFPHYEKEMKQKIISFLNKVVLNSDKEDQKREAMGVLLDIIMHHRPPIKNLEERHAWEPYKIHILDQVGIPELILDDIVEGLNVNLDNFDSVSTSLLCLPHVQELDLNGIASFVDKILDDTMNLILQVSSVDERRKLLFLLNIIVEFFILNIPERVLSVLINYDLYAILEKFPELRSDHHLLRVIDFHLSFFAESRDENCENLLTEESFNRIYKLISPSLSSPLGLTRLFTSHILSLFPLKLAPLPKGCKIVPKGLFSVMYEIECTPLTALNFNERNRLMTSIDAEHIDSQRPVSGACDDAPVLFAIGQFYVNLNIWKPVQKFIAGYAKTMDSEIFWKLWQMQLDNISLKAFKSLTSNESNSAMFIEGSSLFNVNEYLTFHENFQSLSKQINHLNARDCMWRSMLLFPSVCEANASYIVKTFEDFLKLEMKSPTFNVAPTQNLLNNVTVVDLDDDDEVEEKENTGKYTFSTLCNYLQLFALFAKIKHLDEAKKLENLFMDFMVHPSNVVRGYAIGCIFAFNRKYINPYKETIMRIHDSRTFKSGVSAFQIDSTEGDSSIHVKHRKRFMAFYIRFLYGRMHGNLGKNTVGKHKVNERKALVIRLLGGITHEESEVLLNLAFEIIMPQIEGSTLEVVRKTLEGVDPTQCIPLKILTGMLGTLDSMLNHLGNILPTNQPFFLKLILKIISYVTVLQDQNADISITHENSLKNIKSLALTQLFKFFDYFDNYAWSSDEVEALFLSVVWPMLPKLKMEGLVNIHTLLKLFRKWCDIDKLQPLLIKHHPDDVNIFPLKLMFELAINPKCKYVVTNYILQIVYSLMGIADNTFVVPRANKKKDLDMENGTSLDPQTDVKMNEFVDCSDLLSVNEPVSRIEGPPPTYGTKILIPHITELTHCMLSIAKTLVRSNENTERNLRVLCEITRYNVSSDQGDQLLHILISMLVGRKVSDTDVVTHLLQTCAHLIPISKKRDFFCSKILRLFHILTGRENRSALCDIFDEVNKVDDKYMTISRFMRGFNSFEKSIIVSIHKEKRLMTYKSAIRHLKTVEEFDEMMFGFLMNQCTHDMNSITDITLLEGCQMCVKELMITLCRFSESNPQLYKQHMNSILNHIKSGFNVVSDEVHCFCMKLMKIAMDITLDKTEISKMKSLKGLKNLTNFNKKFDFFMEITNIQIGRRANAIYKIAHALQKGDLVLSDSTVEVYLWPLVSRYLTKPRYENEPDLLKASVECVGVISKRLPWRVYSEMLKFFMNKLLGKMNNPRIGLKVVSIILDAFHEDVSTLSFEENTGEEVSISGKRKRDDVVNGFDSGDEDSDEKEQKVKISSENKVNSVVLKKDPALAKKQEHARSVYRFLVKEIIPSLKRVFESRSKESKKHKFNKSALSSDDDDIKKVPLALPLVKLLKKFPTNVLEANIRNLFYQLIGFLKSHKQSVRKTAVDIILGVLEEAGGKYLPRLVNDLIVCLHAGFMRHVLLFTIRRILTGTSDSIKTYISPCIADIMKICCDELFSDKEERNKSEDKDEEKANVVEESKGIKSFSIIKVLGKFVHKDEILHSVILPLKFIVNNTIRNSYVKDVAECLENFMDGLKDNEKISLEDKCKFIYGVVDDKIKDLCDDDSGNMDSNKQRKFVWDIPDRRLLEPEPKRMKIMAKTSKNANNFIFKYAAFILLNKMMKFGVLVKEDDKHCSYLDPFVGHFKKYLMNCKNDELTVECLRSVFLMLKFSLPSFQDKMQGIVNGMFIFINKYSSTEVEKGTQYDIVQLSFRNLANIIGYISYYQLQRDHLKVLLLYIQEHLMNNLQQETLFFLLKSIVNKKIDTPELASVMEHIKNLIVTCTTSTIADQLIKIYVDYIIKDDGIEVNVFHTVMSFFIDNLEYAEPRGRISVCLVIDNFIANVPSENFKPKLLDSLCMQLSLALIKEDSLQCMKHQRQSLKMLFNHMKQKERIIKHSLTFMKDDPSNPRSVNATRIRLGCQALQAYLENQPSTFPTLVLTEVVPVVVSLLHPSRFEEIDSEDSNEQECLDRSMLELLRLFGRLFITYCKKPKWKKLVTDSVWKNIVNCLAYAVIEVRILACHLLGELFDSFPVDKKMIPSVIASNTDMFFVADALVGQFSCNFPTSDIKYKELHTITIQNLIYLIRQSVLTPILSNKSLDDNSHLTKTDFEHLESLVKNSSVHGQVASSTAWVLRAISKACFEDIPIGKFVRREALLNFIKFVVEELGEVLVESGPALEAIMAYLAREDKSSENEEFSMMLVTVTENIKEYIGWDLYSKLLHQAESELARKRLARRVYKKEKLLKN